MSERPRSTVSMRRFGGLVTNEDPHDLQPGEMQVQQNMQVVSSGRMQCRRGMQTITFANGEAATANDVIAISALIKPESSLFVYEDSAGNLRSGKAPSVSSTGAAGAGAPTVDTGLNTFEPLNFTVTADGKIIATNGVDRGLIWDGRTTGVYELGIDAPKIPPTITTSGTGGPALTGDYYFAYRWVDADGVGSSLSPPTKLLGVSNAAAFHWSGFDTTSQTRVIYMELYRTTGSEFTEYYRVAKLPNTATSFTTDTLADTPLGDEPVATAGIVGNISASANSSGFVEFTTDATFLYVGAVISVANHSVDAYNQVQHIITSRPDSTHIVTDCPYISSGTGGQWTLQNIALANGDGGEDDGYRFTPPPNFKSKPLFFQDRLWLGIDVVYNAGTATFTATGRSVTGTSTAWTPQMVGRFIYPLGDTKGYRIVAVADATHLTIATAANSTITDGAYAIRPDPVYEDQFFYSEVQEPESMRATNEVQVQRRTGDCDLWTEMNACGPAMFWFRQRSVYKVTYVAQPNIDVSITLFAARGCLNQRCSDLADGNLYVIDMAGIYSLDGSGVDDTIGQPIGDLFRDGLIDFSLQNEFHVKADPVEGVVRFHLALIGDAALLGVSGPARALCYNYRLKTWWTETYAWPLRCSALMIVNNRLRRFSGSTEERIFIQGEGLLDGTTKPDGAVYGTVTAVTDGANFSVSSNSPSDCNGATIGMISGAAKGQLRRLDLSAGGAGGETLQADVAFSPPPAVGDVYAIGAIEWLTKSGVLDLQTDGARTKSECGVTFAPTATPTQLDARVYFNHDALPQTMQVGASDGDGFTFTNQSPDAVMDMRVDRDAKGVAPGFESFGFGNLYDSGVQPERFLAIELRGFQAETLVQVYAIDLTGVTGGS